MQLNLFEDNNRQILLNIADEFLGELDFEQAAPIYGQLLDEHPGDQQIIALQKLATEWADRFSDPDADWRDPEQLYQFRELQKLIPHPPLSKAVQTFIIEAVLNLPDPQNIYRTPDFHIGLLLLEARRLHEAAELLQAALLQPDLPAGRLMAWYADALTLLKQADDALGWYLAALVLDPATVRLDTLVNPSIRNLHISLQVDTDGQIPEEEELAWLPVWGIFEELFPLPLPARIMDLLLEGSDLTEKASNHSFSIPKRWFYLLLQAEDLRKQHAETTVRAAVRRRMKELDGYMFSHYLSLLA
jgi:tetratricopeptide (TPR) repeat protein